MRMQKDDTNFHEIAPIFLHGRSAKGYRLICPRDGLPGCSFVEFRIAALVVNGLLKDLRCF